LDSAFDDYAEGEFNLTLKADPDIDELIIGVEFYDQENLWVDYQWFRLRQWNGLQPY
jgi:hypothetical protein